MARRRRDSPDSPRRRLLIFGKLPEPGAVKTRLIPQLGPAAAARLYEAFLDDAVDTARGLADAVIELWVPRRPNAEPKLAARYPGVSIRWQGRGDLGARMSRAFASSFADGADYVLITGSDHPTLPLEFLERGFAALVAAHLVLGPSHDGGYYAIALRRYAWPRAAGLFQEIPWSTPRVLDRTRARAVELGLCHVELPAWYDVDDADQLTRVACDAGAASHTARVLRRLVPDLDPGR